MFQKTITSKYLKTHNTENLVRKWDLFKADFHNPEIQSKIKSTDKEIDQMVYELYGLNEEEVGIVKNN